MRDLRCPRDGEILERVKDAGLVTARCPACGGRALSIVALRSVSRGGVDRRIWRAAAEGPPRSGAPCPACLRRGTLVNVPDARDEALEVDVCRSCALVWFDAGEREQLGTPPEGPAPEAARQVKAERLAEGLLVVGALRGAHELGGKDPRQAALAARLGVSPEAVAPARRPAPFTGLIAAASLGMTAWGARLLDWSWPGLALRPQELFEPSHRWVTHLLAPTDPAMGLVLAFLMVMVGHDLERIWGPLRLAATFALSGALGGALHSLLTPLPEQAVGGLWAPVTALAVLYTFELPDAKFLFVWRDRGLRSLRGPVRPMWGSTRVTPGFYLGLWALLLVGVGLVNRALPGAVSASPWMGVGGGLAAAVAWFTLRPPPPR